MTTDLTPEQREAALRKIARALAGSDPEGRGDNLAILLCERFEAHPDCPEDGELDEFDCWNQWAVDRQHDALDTIAEAALDALRAAGWRPEPQPDVQPPAEWADEDGRRVKNGAGTKAPLYVYADADYEEGDGSTGLHETVKRANEPAIQYVRADAISAAEARAAKDMQWRISEVVEAFLFNDPNGDKIASGALADAILGLPWPLPPAGEYELTDRARHEARLAAAEARGYARGVEAAMTSQIQLADVEDGPEPTLERMARLYYTGRIDDWKTANRFADRFLAAVRALSPAPKEPYHD